MTTYAVPTDEMTPATPEELRVAVASALSRAGVRTFAELEAQARAGRFDSVQARMAWVAVSTLGEYSPA